MPSPATKKPIFQVPELCGRYGGADILVASLGDGGRTAKGFRNRELIRSLEATHPGTQHVVFVQITSGNSGYDLGVEAKEAQKRTGRRIDVVNIVPKGISPVIKAKLAECSFVHEMSLSRLITMEEMKKIAKEITGYEGSEQEILGVERYNLHDGYRAVVRQMAEEGLKPNYIFCPAGGGELLTEIAAEAEKVWGKGAPKIIGITIPQNVLVQKEDFVKKAGRSIADKLVCGYSKFKELVREFVRRGMAELRVVKEDEIEREYTYLNGIGIPAEPSAAVAFAGAKSYGLNPSDTVVIINTGMGIYDRNAVDKLWARKAKRWLRYAAIFAAGIIAAVGIKFGYDRVQAYRHEQQRIAQELRLQEEINDDYARRDRIMTAMQVTRGSIMRYTMEDVRSACGFLGHREKVCDNYRDERDFSKLEIYFLNQIYSLSFDNWAAELRSELLEKWKNGTYEPDMNFYKEYPECMRGPPSRECLGSRMLSSHM